MDSCYESIFIILISVDLIYGDQADMVPYRRSPRNCQMPPLRRAMTAQMMPCSSRNVVNPLILFHPVLLGSCCLGPSRKPTTRICPAQKHKEMHTVVRSETTTTATTLSAGAVGGSGGDVLDAADSHAGTGEGTEGRLGTGAGGLGAVTTGGTDLDVEGSDADLLAAGSDVLGGQHGGVGGGLVTVGLDLHSTGDTADGLATGQIGDVDEGVVERGEDTGNTEHQLAWREGIASVQWLIFRNRVKSLEFFAELRQCCDDWGNFLLLTLTDVGAEGDVLLGSGGLLGRGHLDCGLLMSWEWKED